MQVPPPPPPFGGPSVITFLPPGWTEHVAPTGQPYFFNAVTGESTYVRPGSLSGIPPPPPAGFGLASDPGNEEGNVADASKKRKRKEKAAEKLSIPGTSWLRVTTTQGNVFYTNIETKASIWTVPEEIAEQLQELLRVQEESQNGIANGHAETSNAAVAALLLKEKEEEMQKLREELEREREASRQRRVQEEEKEQESEQLILAKRARMSASADGNPEPIYDIAANEHFDAEGAEDVEDQEAEPVAELEDWEKEELQGKAELEADLLHAVSTAPGHTAAADPSFSSEEGIALFKMMLTEKDVNPMRPWDAELPKIINDPRYKGVKSLRERKELFDEHCKHLVREKRAKKNKQGDREADPASLYRLLLVAEVKSTRTHWEDFRKKFKKDSRFRDFGRDDREKEKAFRGWLRELGEIKRADAQKAEEKFREMLEERQLAQETGWSEVKSLLSSDPRYLAVVSSSAREETFNKYMSTRMSHSFQSSTIDPEEAKRKAAEERKAKQAASLKEREDKVKQDKTALERAAGKSRVEAGREESGRAYKALLIDAVRDHEARWSDAVPDLEQDSRFSNSTLSLPEKRRIFDEHTSELYTKRIKAVEDLFEAHSPSLQSDFKDIYPQLATIAAVMRMNMSENDIKRLYEGWSRRRYAQARTDFEALLSESNFVEYWGRLKQEAVSKDEERARGLLDNDDEDTNMEDAVDLKTMASQIDLKELQAVLKHDKRFTTFDYAPDSREKWITEYIEKLGKPKQTVHQHH